MRSARPLALALMLALAHAPATAQDYPVELVKKLNKLHEEMSTCIAYFTTVQRCLGDDPKYKDTVAGYGMASERLFAMSFKVGETIGLTPDAAQARLGMAAQGMVQLIEKNCINIASLLGRYSDRCVEVSNDPLKAAGVPEAK